MEDQERAEGGANPVPKVLVVDDEQKLVELVQNYLVAEGFEVLVAYDGPSALEIARTRQPDLVVLDVMLPGLDGIEVCRQLRHFSDAYVLMLTARAEEIDKIIGLSVGADDYLTKPFSPRELVARAKAMLRRSRASKAARMENAASDGDISPPMIFGELVIDLARHEVIRGGQPVHLTLREFNLLATLAANPGRVYTRDQLLLYVWGGEYFGDHVVDVRITNLRKKLDDNPADPRYIETVRGVGYRFKSPSPEERKV